VAKRVLLGPIDENAAVVSCHPSGSSKHASFVEPTNASEGSLEGFDGSNEAHVLSYIADVETEFEKRKGSMDAEAENICLQLETIKQSSLLKLNKSVRKMTVRQFQDQYGSDMDAVCRAVLDENEYLPSVAVTAQQGLEKGKVDEFGRPLRTPARMGGGGNSILGRTPATVRAARKGELL